MTSITIANDHGGFEYKGLLKSHLESKGFRVQDFGTDSTDPVDYPDFVRAAARSVAARGLWIVPAGRYGNVIRFMPPPNDHQ